MKAMIFAAGLGTRLRPFTLNKPKALIEINNVSLLEICILNLIKYGFNDIIINVHHFADSIINFLNSKNNFNINITISDERDLLLETGGGLVKAKSLLGKEPFLVHNVDIISDINLTDFFNSHNKNSLATLAVMERKSSRYLYFSNDNELIGWIDTKKNKEIITREDTDYKRLAFMGIHVISPKIFDFIENSGSFSIIPEYLNISKDKTIIGKDYTGAKWIDVGKPESLEKAKQLINCRDS